MMERVSLVKVPTGSLAMTGSWTEADEAEAMMQSGVSPKVKPIRGGTDGAQLSYKGLPCPNIFAGGVNFHGPYEFVSVQVMEKAMNVIIKICEIVADYND